MRAIKIRSAANDIAEVFEDFLAKRNVVLDTSEIEKEDAGDKENESVIYGMDWAEIVDGVEDLLIDMCEKHGVNWEYEYEV